ncbi:Uncharacterised protein [Mycobacterium tuberculosis]|nr:Uncharacterised protein [Mycobacterium tuberculosis]
MVPASWLRWQASLPPALVGAVSPPGAGEEHAPSVSVAARTHVRVAVVRNRVSAEEVAMRVPSRPFVIDGSMKVT